MLYVLKRKDEIITLVDFLEDGNYVWSREENGVKSELIYNQYRFRMHESRTYVEDDSFDERIYEYDELGRIAMEVQVNKYAESDGTNIETIGKTMYTYNNDNEFTKKKLTNTLRTE